ncbi:MAG: RluA family pseudouridine synthase [Eubacteriales bacterium]|nr:RluA family pseudouridine synthase [Eubacteriales bacterium]
MRKWEYVINIKEQGKSLEQVLKAAGFSKKEISRQKFIPGGILLDGKPCRTTAIVKAGQKAEITLREKGAAIIPPAGNLPGLSVCYEDQDLLIADKPPGLSCHPGKGHYRDNLGAQVTAWCRDKGEDFPIRQIGRLDKDTSGLVVFAKNQIAAARLWKQREEGSFKKIYQALVRGRLQPAEGVIDLPLRRMPGEKNKMCTAPDGKRAVTCYRVQKEEIWEGTEVSFVECRLETGRTHQIRVHMAALGHPLVGDCIYGAGERGERLCLHAARLTLVQPFTEKIINIDISKKGIPF